MQTTTKRTILVRAAMMLLFTLLGATGAWAEVVTIGDEGGSADMPISASHSYVLTQQIVTAEQINHAEGKIWSIAFNTEKGDVFRDIAIYITPTELTYLSSSEFQAVKDDDCMFKGNVAFITGQWNTIYFDKPFEYDGTSNLIITFDDNTGFSSGSWGALLCQTFSGNSIYAYSEKKDLSPTDLTTLDNASYKSSVSYQSQIQFAFGDYPTPAGLAVTDVGDVSALVQCSLRGEAAAWNLRYRKVAKDGEEEQPWTTKSDLTERSFTLEELQPATKYEVQVQAVFAEEKLSDWTSSLVFTTACCPVEEQAEIIYAVNSNYSNWYGFAIQFIDITNEENPIEVAYINPLGSDFKGGNLTLCCGHKYRVNWIYDEEHSNVINSFSLALYFQPGDKFFSMACGEAPSETAELTTFVMDCTPYCAQMPQTLSVTGTTYESATITFVSETKKGQVVYSTEADFDPETATPKDVDFEELPESDDPWGGIPPNASLTLKGLQPLTEYYVRVRSVCTAEPIGTSRWSEPVKVTTGSRYDAPTQVIAEPVNSRTEKTSWGGRGTEKGYNLYYRKQAAGNPVDPDAIKTFGGGNGSGFQNGSWGDGIWSSYGDRPFSNTIFVSNVPAGSSFGFKAGNGKTGAGLVKFLYGMQKQQDGAPLDQMKKFDKKCLNDADRAAIIKGLVDKMNETTDEELIAALRAEIEELKSLPTDAQKLEQMRTLEKNIEDNVAALDALALKNANGEITDEEFKSQSDVLKAQNALYGAELSELRAITTNAENPQKDGFSVSREKETANARTRGDNTYIFFIRHSDPNGVLLVTDLTITPPEQVGEWTVIKNLSKTEYSLTGLEPGTAYEVMVEPVYADGTTGSQNPITVFVTIGTETDPSVGVFSVSKGKKVQFARGNLRYEGDIYGYESEWTMAKQQYEVLGEENIDNQGEWSFQKYPTDLLCWSTTNNYYGVSTYYWWEEDDIVEAFKGNFVEWGENPTLISQLGAGWRTLSKDEWNYLLNERANAAQLKQFATIAIDEENKVKGLVLIPDEWTAPDGVVIGDEMNLEQWAAVEQTGVVFLPVTGHLWTWKDDEGHDQASVNGLDMIGNYWSSTPSSEDPDVFAFALNFNDPDLVPTAEMERRLGCAVRLVKEVEAAPLPKEESIVMKTTQLAYVSEYDLNFKDIDGLKVYVATGYDKTTGTIWLSRVYDVPAGTGFLMMGDADTYEIPVNAAGSTSYYKNMFKGTLEGTTLQTTDGDFTNYYLSKGDEGLGFYKVGKDGVKLGKNRAYLPIPTVIEAVGEAGSKVAVSVGGAEQVPYYSDQSLDFTTMEALGMKAYTATGYDYSTGTIWLSRVKQVPALTGVLIMAPKGDYEVPTASVASVYENMFKGTLGGTTIFTEEDGFINYYLSKGAEGVGFYKVTKAEGVALGPNRCYLQIPKVKPSAASRGAEASEVNATYGIGTSETIGIQLLGSRGSNGDGTTGIKSIDNGKLKIEDDVYYNLNGQRVDKPGKGLYIHNGRKVMIK